MHEPGSKQTSRNGLCSSQTFRSPFGSGVTTENSIKKLSAKLIALASLFILLRCLHKSLFSIMSGLLLNVKLCKLAKNSHHPLLIALFTNALTRVFIAGYYQPAGPLISVPHGHTQQPPPPPPITKSAPLSETSPTAASPIHQPPPAPSSNGGDSSDSEVKWFQFSLKNRSQFVRLS